MVVVFDFALGTFRALVALVVVVDFALRALVVVVDFALRAFGVVVFAFEFLTLDVLVVVVLGRICLRDCRLKRYMVVRAR